MTGLKKCYVKNCTNYGSFRFPSNSELRSKWVEAIRCETNSGGEDQVGSNLNTSFLCRGHFEDSDVKKAKDGRLKLKSSAVPSLKPTNPIKQKINVTKPPSQQKVHCDICNKVFTRKANLEKHLKKACGNVHCKENHEHQVINLQFDSFEEGEAYMTAEEMDSKFIRRSIKQAKQKNRTKHEQAPDTFLNGSVAVYFECRQALKNRKTGLGNNCSAKLVLSKQICEKGKSEQTRHYRLKGCIAHAEGCEDEVGRMTKQQKKNITNLLRIGMSRAAVCNRYLGRENFGGNFGKFDSLKGKNKNSWISKIQRMNCPFPPDPDCNELEMVKRYCSMASVRCYNVGVVVQNLFGYHKKAQTKDFIMVFMEDWQRQKFKFFPKSLIILCTPNIHTIHQYNLLSILVLDNHGQCVPIIQAISANDINTTIRTMFENITELERVASSNVKLIMSDNACFNEVQECFCDIFTDNSNVNLIPCYNIYTDDYNRNIQVSLRIPSDRLDRLIYAIHEMNSRYGFKEERLAIEFYDSSKPWPIAELERCHPTDIAFEISSQSKTTWSVTQSSWNVGDINTSHYVSFLHDEESICKPDKCRVKCSRCPVVPYCAHQFNCTCSEFTSKRICTHIHVIIMNNLMGKKDLQFDDHSSEGNMAIGKENIILKGKENMQCGGDDNLTNDGVGLKKQRKEISEQVEALPSSIEVDLKEEAKSSLWSLIRYIDELSLSSENLQDICKSVIKTSNNLLPKNKQMSCKISRVAGSADMLNKLTVCEDLNGSIDNHENLDLVPINSDSERNKLKYHEVKKTKITKNNVPVGAQTLNDGTPYLKLNEPVCTDTSNEIKTNRHILGLNKPRFTALKYALNADVWDFSWWLLACSKPEDSLLILSQAFNSDERDKILEKFVLAKTVWSCGKCQNSTVDSILSGYIECSVCCEWFHRTCCNSEILSEVLEDQFTCEKCATFSSQQLTHNNVFTDVVSYIVTDVRY